MLLQQKVERMGRYVRKMENSLNEWLIGKWAEQVIVFLDYSFNSKEQIGLYIDFPSIYNL